MALGEVLGFTLGDWITSISRVTAEQASHGALADQRSHVVSAEQISHGTAAEQAAHGVLAEAV